MWTYIAVRFLQQIQSCGVRQIALWWKNRKGEARRSMSTGGMTLHQTRLPALTTPHRIDPILQEQSLHQVNNYPHTSATMHLCTQSIAWCLTCCIPDRGYMMHLTFQCFFCSSNQPCAPLLLWCQAVSVAGAGDIQIQPLVNHPTGPVNPNSSGGPPPGEASGSSNPYRIAGVGTRKPAFGSSGISSFGSSSSLGGQPVMPSYQPPPPLEPSTAALQVRVGNFEIHVYTVCNHNDAACLPYAAACLPYAAWCIACRVVRVGLVLPLLALCLFPPRHRLFLLLAVSGVRVLQADMVPSDITGSIYALKRTTGSPFPSLIQLLWRMQWWAALISLNRYTFTLWNQNLCLGKEVKFGTHHRDEKAPASCQPYQSLGFGLISDSPSHFKSSDISPDN
jgi:hypothetical protein